MDDKIKLILHNVQQGASCHQKYLKILENHYHKIPFENFIKDFFIYLKYIFHMDISIRNPFVERTLEFLAQFVSVLTKPNETEPHISLDEDSPSHPFLTQVIYETLRFHDLAYVQTRYYSCRFITLILQHIGYETHLDNDICDSIQESMLERILDPKASIRLQAVMALVRLQEPLNPDCPVIKAYLSLLIDANPLIRKEVVKKIAPNAITIPKISERIRDVDYHVRIAAYTRCADIGPKLFKIIVRQQILKCGFHDDNKHVKLVFMENLLPKWLSAYNGDFLAFLSALKLDADENDIVNTEEISKQVMEVFFRNVPVKEIIDALPIDNDKLMPLNNLTSEVITYWNIVTNFLRSSDETEEYLDNILPELTPFSNYIQSIIDLKTSKKMEEWEYLDYQYILYNLFDMAEQYDLGDEVGRRAFHKLVMSILQNHKLQFKLAKKVIGIADKLMSNVDVLSNEICQIISDIREPLVDQPASQDESTNNTFQMAELKVKINILQGDIEDALDSQDFQKASVIKNELMEYKKKLEDLSKQNQVIKVKVSKDDPETICRCLDLLSALLELPSVNSLSPALATCQTEFVLPLLTSDIVEVNWRVLKCLALFCLFDKSLAEGHIKVLCIPIATYRAIPNYNKFALMESVAAICDLMRVHGSELFGSEEDTNNTASQHNTTRRRLYRNEDMDDVTVMDHNRMNVEFIIEIILDMLDDESEDIRETAITGISKLILTDFPVSPLLISRIILKWFNPLTGIADACSSSRPAKLRKLDNEKAGDRIQQKLGSLISNYVKLTKGSREIIGKAVIPTLTSIASAPRTSPLADVDIENVVRFLAAITNSNETTDIVHIHTNLAHTLYYKIASKPKDPVVPYLSKMLLYLEIPAENSAVIKELITEFQLVLEEEEDGLDKGPRKSVTKFVEKLKASLTNGTVIEESLGDLESTVQQTDNTSARTDVNKTVETTENNLVETGTMRKSIEGRENDRSEESSNSIDERIQEKLEENEKENLQTATGNKNKEADGKEVEVGACNGTEEDTDSDQVRRPKRTRKNRNEVVKNQVNKKQTREDEMDSNSSYDGGRSKRRRTHSNRLDPTGELASKGGNIATGDDTPEADSDSTAEEKTPPRQKRPLRQAGLFDNKGKETNVRKNKNLNSVDKINNATNDNTTEADSDSTAGEKTSNKNLNSVDKVQNATDDNTTEADSDSTTGEKTPQRQRGSLRHADLHENQIREINFGENKNSKSVNKINNTSGKNTTETDSDGTSEGNTPQRQRRSLRKTDLRENKIKKINVRKNKNGTSVDKVNNAAGDNTTEVDSDSTAGEKTSQRQRRSLRHADPCENRIEEIHVRSNKNLKSVDKENSVTSDETTKSYSDSTSGENLPQRHRRSLRHGDPYENKIKEKNVRKNKNVKSADKEVNATADKATKSNSDSTSGENSPRQRRSLRHGDPDENKIKEINVRKNKNVKSADKEVNATGDKATKSNSDSTSEESTPQRQRRSLRHVDPCENKSKEINVKKNKNLKSVGKQINAAGNKTKQSNSDSTSGENSPHRQRRIMRQSCSCENNEMNTRDNKNRNSADKVNSTTDSDSTAREEIPQRQRRVLMQPDPCENKNNQISGVNLRKNKNLNSADTVINAKNKSVPEQKRRILNREKKFENSSKKNINNDSNTTGEESGKEKNKMKGIFKRTRRGTNKFIDVTRNNKKLQNTNHTTSKKDKTNDVESDSDSSREQRRSKRPRRSLGILDSSGGSKESGRENKSKNIQNQPVSNVGSTSKTNNRYDVQARKSTGHRMAHTDLTIYGTNLRRPVAESTKNSGRMTLRDGTPKSSTENIFGVNGIKRRKSRSKTSLDSDTTGNTSLHTIIEQSEKMSSLDDTSIQTPTSNSSPRKSSRNSIVFSTPTSTISRRSKLIISETSSDSESGSTISSIRRSARKIKKKNMDNYVL